MTLQLVVTRPAREALAWLPVLTQAGFDPLALPLLSFGPPSDSGRLNAARMGLAGFDAVMFVSPQAVHAFLGKDFEINSASAHSSVDFVAINDDLRRGPLRCWAPGPGTAQALERVGVPWARIDQPASDAAQFDSEALWSVVGPQVVQGWRVLVVRGELDVPADVSLNGQGAGREWLADQCCAAGAVVHMCVAYKRQKPDWSPADARSGMFSRDKWVSVAVQQLGGRGQPGRIVARSTLGSSAGTDHSSPYRTRSQGFGLWSRRGVQASPGRCVANLEQLAKQFRQPTGNPRPRPLNGSYPMNDAKLPPAPLPPEAVLAAGMTTASTQVAGDTAQTDAAVPPVAPPLRSTAPVAGPAQPAGGGWFATTMLMVALLALVLSGLLWQRLDRIQQELAKPGRCGGRNRKIPRFRRSGVGAGPGVAGAGERGRGQAVGSQSAAHAA